MDEKTSKVRCYIAGHGEYSTTPEGLDRAIGAYLPASASVLRDIAEERAGHRFEGVYDVSAFLVILADFDDAADDLLPQPNHDPAPKVEAREDVDWGEVAGNEVTADDICTRAAKRHADETGHTTSFRPGHGWVCEVCDGSDAVDDLWAEEV